ncbi:MAG: hypothetical protein ACU0BB_02460 [Paracoccaceae bacterium]
MQLLFTLIFAVVGFPALAQTVENCDWQALAPNLVEPWEANTKTYANGDVRLALLDTVEPAAGSYHLLVLSPPYGELGDRQCRTIGISQGVGFSGVDFGSLRSGYDPAVGLIFDMDVQRFDPDQDDFVPIHLRFNLNQATGDIGAVLE